MTDSNEGFDIAVIGMAGKFPGAENIDAFWEILKNGVEAVTFFTDQELIDSGIDPQLIKNANYVKSRAIIEDEDKFDAQFFDLFPREVEVMDPQQRLFLETAWQALENAGYHSDLYDGLIGLFGGISLNTYLYSFLMAQKGMISSAEGYQLSIGNDKDFLTTRVSYKLNLTGPSVNVQTACSTSLVAIHLACQNLLNYNCDMAMAGGVSVTVPQKQGYLYQEGMILSRDGHCRAFSDDASGTISGSGVGLVVLKRLDEALEDGDHIYAVIKGSAYNNDGANRVGYTAPSVDGQSEVIANAQAVADIDPDTISYIETHGTGTVLGDPIEISALSQVFGEHTRRKQFCAIGSVKTNIGHLDAAAGVAGFIKTALALSHKQLPPSLNFNKPNPKIDFENSPFYVNTALQDWKNSNGSPLRAGISSFGIGGTNAHAILEEAPPTLPGDPGRPHQLLVFSAQTSSALDKVLENFTDYLEQHADISMADAAFTLQVGRKPFKHRRILVCSGRDDALAALKPKDPKRLLSASHQKDPQNAPIAFMFSGQGAQYVNMGKGLYETEPIFREELDHCFQILEGPLNFNLKSLFYPQPGMEKDTAAKLAQTYITQPAIFALEYALAKFWISCGIEPAAMVGHSIGEYVAACLSGVMSLEDALKLVAARGKLMQDLPEGAMISVQLSETEAEVYCNENLNIAGLNSEGSTVLSGTFTAVESLEKQLETKSIKFQRLHTSHAFHSAMMDPILDSFLAIVKQVVLNEPQLPYLSNVSGTWITREQAQDPAYYVTHLRKAVRFMDNVGRLLEEDQMILLEVGPGNSLCTLARRHPKNSLGRQMIPSLRHPNSSENDSAFFLNSMGLLWLRGVQPDWFAYYGNERRLRLALPTYPFERKRYWLQSAPVGGTVAAVADDGKNADISNWFYIPSWKQNRIPLTMQKKNGAKNWLIFKDTTGLASHVIDALKDSIDGLVVVEKSSSYEQKAENQFSMRPGAEEDYKALYGALEANGFKPDHVLHFWNVGIRQQQETFEQIITPGFKSLVYLTRHLLSKWGTYPIKLDIISRELYEISGFEHIEPGVATLLGPGKVMTQEFPHISCRTIDVMLPQKMDNKIVRLAEQLAIDFVGPRSELALAYRGKERWVQHFDAYPLTPLSTNDGYLKQKGVYVITGGMGRIGMALANQLAISQQARLVLIEHLPLPDKKDWNSWLEEKGTDDLTSIKIKRLQNLEHAGAEVLVLQADISNADQTRTAFEKVEAQFGKIDGVIHAAGIIGARAFKALPELKEEDWMEQFRAKVFGAHNIASALEGKAVDFVLLQSSMSSILGGLGFGAYAAANAYLDALAYEQNRESDTQWISVNWDGWNFENQQQEPVGLGSEIAQLSILPEEGLQAFERIFSYRGFPQIVVSTGNLQHRIDKWLKLSSEADLDASQKPASGSLHDRPDLATAFVAPENDLQKAVVKVWQSLLGIDPIGIHDDFFDLGGNSLMGTQLISQLRETFKVELPLRSLFEDPTVAGVAKIIREQSDAQADGEMAKIADMLDQMENLSDEEVAKMLKDKKNN